MTVLSLQVKMVFCTCVLKSTALIRHLICSNSFGYLTQVIALAAQDSGNICDVGDHTDVQAGIFE